MFEPVLPTQTRLFGFAVDVAYSSLVGVLVEIEGQMPLFCLHTVKRIQGQAAHEFDWWPNEYPKSAGLLCCLSPAINYPDAFP